MRLVEFAADPEAAREAINQCVSIETRGKIQDLIPSGPIDTLTHLVLANRIYFKAAWLHAFDPDATTTEPLHLLDGSTEDVPMMHHEEPHRSAVGDGYRVLELGYESGDMSMLIILPDEGEIQAIEEALGPEMVEEIVANLTDCRRSSACPSSATSRPSASRMAFRTWA